MSELTECALRLKNYLQKYVNNEYSCCGSKYWYQIKNYADEIVRLSEEQDEILQKQGINIDNLLKENQKDTISNTSSTTPKLWIDCVNNPVPQ